MNRPTCKTCPYWGNVPVRPTEGECRRSTPLCIFTDKDRDDMGPGLSHWPETNRNDWCGKHPDFPAYIESRVAVLKRKLRIRR